MPLVEDVSAECGAKNASNRHCSEQPMTGAEACQPYGMRLISAGRRSRSSTRSDEASECQSRSGVAHVDC